MRKSLAAIAGLVLVLGACTTAGSTDTTAFEAAPEPVVAAAPAPTTTLAPTATEAPVTTTSTTVPLPAAPETPATNDAPEAAVGSTTTQAPVAIAEEPDPVLTEPAYVPNITLTSGGSAGPITIYNVTPGATVSVPFEAESDVPPFLGTWFWSINGVLDDFSGGNPTSISLDLVMPTTSDSATFTIEALAFNAGTGSATIEVTLSILSS